MNKLIPMFFIIGIIISTIATFAFLNRYPWKSLSEKQKKLFLFSRGRIVAYVIILYITLIPNSVTITILLFVLVIIGISQYSHRLLKKEINVQYNN